MVDRIFHIGGKIRSCNDAPVLVDDNGGSVNSVNGKAGTHPTYGDWWMDPPLQFITYSGIIPVSCWDSGTLYWRILAEDDSGAGSLPVGAGFSGKTTYCTYSCVTGKSITFTGQVQALPGTDNNGDPCSFGGGGYRGVALACVCFESTTTVNMSVSGPVERQSVAFDYCLINIDGQTYAQIQGTGEGFACWVSNESDSGSVSVDPGLHRLLLLIDSVDQRNHDVSPPTFTLTLS